MAKAGRHEVRRDHKQASRGLSVFSDSKFSDYKATNTPARRDLIRPWVKRFAREGLGVDSTIP